MAELRRAHGPVLVERGKDDSVLIIAFTGGVGKLQIPVFEFFETTKSLGYSRILLRDQYNQHYHRGIDSQRSDFPGLIAYLKDEIARLGPQKIVCVGTSAGAYAAIMAGHHLGADVVHAFGPQTGPESPIPGVSEARSSVRDNRGRFDLVHLLTGRRKQKLLDLTELLKNGNGKTTYFIHYCRGCVRDRLHAEHISGLPRMFTIGYPCDTHLVTIYMAKKGFLEKAINIDNPYKLIEMARAHFPGVLDIKEGSAS
jgi:hypothetical protein